MVDTAPTTPDFTDHTMIALRVPASVAGDLTVPGGLDPADMHITVAYTGTTGQVDPDALLAAALDVIHRPPIHAQISGHARFTGTGDGTDAIVALVDSPALETLRRDLLDALANHGITQQSTHGYTPHITLTYLPEDADSPISRLEPQPVLLDTLTVHHGGTVTRLPLLALDSLEAIAADAYAQGWARSGGPMTDRVRAGYTAAVAMATQHADTPGVLEATLHLGHLEGTWARVFERRDRLRERAQRNVTTAVKPLLADLDFSPAIRTARHLAPAGPSEAVSDNTKALISHLADLILGVLRKLTRHANWVDVRDAMRTVVAEATAEGRVDALAISAEQLHRIGFQFDLAFEQQMTNLQHLDELYAGADDWLSTMLADAAKQVGRVLADGIRAGLDGRQLADAVAAVLESDDQQAIAYATSMATDRALSAGALDLYASEGVLRVEFMTAGDARVDAMCDDAEANGPYELADAPVPPLHPNCRCCLSPVEPLPATLITPYLEGE